MKKLMMVAMTLIVAMSTAFADYQSDIKDIYKQRQEIKKMSKAELKAKVDKATKTQVKDFKKQGWTVKPGNLPLEKQQERANLMELELDEKSGFPKFIIGRGTAIAENYTAAQRAASLQASVQLAEQIGKEVGALAEGSVGNEELRDEDAASIGQAAEASIMSIQQSIDRTITVLEMYRLTSQKTYEVRIVIAYNGEMAKEAAKKGMREELEKKGNDLHKKMDKLLGL